MGLISQKFSCENVKAFISFSDQDRIYDMREDQNLINLPVYSITGEIITMKFENFIQGILEKHLILYSGFDLGEHWTGSDGHGKFVNDRSCNMWTDGTSSFRGYYGELNRYISNSNTSPNRYIYAGQQDCNNELKLLCLCY